MLGCRERRPRRSENIFALDGQKCFLNPANAQNNVTKLGYRTPILLRNAEGGVPYNTSINWNLKRSSQFSPLTYHPSLKKSPGLFGPGGISVGLQLVQQLHIFFCKPSAGAVVSPASSPPPQAQSPRTSTAAKIKQSSFFIKTVPF